MPIKKLIACIAIAALQINTLTPVWAALAQKPLLSSNGAVPKPNVILTLDNSESMALNHMPESLAGTNIVRMHPEDNLSIASHTLLDSFGFVPATGNCDADVFECKMRSADVNTIYYNPTVHYKPWFDSRDPSKRLPNSLFSAAPIDPMNQAVTVNLATIAAQTARWCNTNVASRSNNSCAESKKNFNPGIFYRLKANASNDAAASYTLVNLNAGEPDYGRKDYPQRTDCPAIGNCPLATEQTNFANWFTYYRARILFTKAALSEAFASQGDTVRLGWGFTSSVTAPSVPEVDGQSILGGPVQGVRDFTETHKKTFLKTIQNISLTGSTPLRFVMDGVGQYFKKSTRPWQDDPSRDTSTTSPLSCRRAYNILTTDGYYNDNGSVNVNYANSAEPKPDVDGQKVEDGTDIRYVPTAPYADAANASSLADIAMYYWAHDLNTSIANNVAPSTSTRISDPAYYDTEKNPATWQHLTQFTVGVGVSGSLDPTKDLDALKNGTKTWPVISSDASKIDDLWHAAVNSRGKFYLAKDASSFKTAIKNAIGQTGLQGLKEGGVAIAGLTIQSSSRKYVSSYNTYSDAPWSGDFYAYNLNIRGKVTGKEEWSIATKAKGDEDSGLKPMTAANRKIFTWNPDPTQPAAVRFECESLGNNNQKLMPTGSVDLINYLRGETLHEGSDTGQYRERNGAKFADFINSNIVYVKDHVNLRYGALPALGTSPSIGLSYGKFLDEKEKRKPAVVFVGGNGGFLHGFQDNVVQNPSPSDIELNKKNGTEVFAYVPRGVIPNLPKLAQQDYGRSGGSNEHQYYVDGPLTESDAYIGGAWRNVLVGSLGAGGKGIYALNVTDLTALGADSVLWDKTLPAAEAGDSDVGYIVTPPQVGVLPNGKWKVFVGNGYDSANGMAALLIYDMADGSLETISVGSSGGNGLGGVALVRNSNQEVMGAYAGDLNGGLWRFEYNAPTGKMVRGYDNPKNNAPFFMAKSSTGTPQPITATPAIVPNPSGGNVIVFGTGKLLEATDKTSSADRQSLYGVWDKKIVSEDTTGLTSPFTMADGVNPRTTQLVQQTITSATPSGPYNVSSAPQTTTSLGWYLDLTIKDGQRLIYPVQTISNYALFGTVAPSSAASPCETLSADGYNFLLPALTGAQANVAILDINGDGIVSPDDGNYSGYKTGADGGDTILLGDGSGSGSLPGEVPCDIHNSANSVACNIPCQLTGTCKGYTVKDRVWKRLLNVPQPGI